MAEGRPSLRVMEYNRCKARLQAFLHFQGKDTRKQRTTLQIGLYCSYGDKAFLRNCAKWEPTMETRCRWLVLNPIEADPAEKECRSYSPKDTGNYWKQFTALLPEEGSLLLSGARTQKGAVGTQLKNDGSLRYQVKLWRSQIKALARIFNSIYRPQFCSNVECEKESAGAANFIARMTPSPFVESCLQM